MPSDIEIAQSTVMEPIGEIARRAGIPEEKLDYYGRYKAKVSLDVLATYKAGNGALILNAFRLLENLNINPAADRLLINILNTEYAAL